MFATDSEEEIRSGSPRGFPTIVCVDDEPLINRSLYRLLSRDPYDVLIADTPLQALQYVQDYDVSLVVTDQRMPDMSGVELLKAVREASPRTAGLILTAYPESVLVDDPPDAPGVPLVAKPWDDDTLRTAIGELIRRGADGPAKAGGNKEAWKALFEEEKVAGAEEESTVLVPLDGSPSAEAALGAIQPLVWRRRLKIELLRVIPHLGLPRGIYSEMEKSRRTLEAAGIPASGDLRGGDPVDQILRQAHHVRANLIALTTRARKGFSGLFGRSVARELLQKADIPVLVCRADMKSRDWKRILVPLDGSREAEAVLPEAVRLACEMSATLLLVRATQPFSYGLGETGFSFPPVNPLPYLQEIARCVESLDVPAETAALRGDPGPEILRYAEEARADLLLMMTRGRRGLARLLFGSVTGRVIRRSPVPVMLRRICAS